MKKLIILGVVVGVLLAVSTVSKAGMYEYEMDIATALDMRLLSSSEIDGDEVDLRFVGTLGGTDQILPLGIYGSPTMINDVGFTGYMSDGYLEGTTPDGEISAVIGLAQPSLLGEFDSFVLPIANDNDDIWKYRAFVIISGESPIYSNGGDWTDLDPDTSTTLTVELGSLVDFTNVTGIGFELLYDTGLNGKTGDQYSTSVVPVPGAILLGLLGMSAAGIRLRKFA